MFPPSPQAGVPQRVGYVRLKYLEIVSFITNCEFAIRKLALFNGWGFERCERTFN
jgi:hypothetical protein